MHRKRQTQQNYHNTTQNFQRRSELQDTKTSPQKRVSLVGRRNMNSTEKLKTRVSIDYNINRAVKENNEDLSHLDQFDSNFGQTNETPFLDLKIVHQGSPSADNAKSQRENESSRLIQDQNENQLAFTDQDLPNSIHDQKQTNRSSQYQFKTPTAGCNDSTVDFRGSCAKQIVPGITKFDESNLMGARNIDEVLRLKKPSINEAFHNYKNSFQSFDNELVCNQYASMGITSGSNEKDKERVLNSETNQTLGVNSSIFSPTAVAMEQTLQTTYQCHEHIIEPEIIKDDDGLQPLSLQLNFNQDRKVIIEDTENNELSCPGSAGLPYNSNSMAKKTGTQISMGRQSNLVHNILSAGSYSKTKNASSISKGRTPIHEKQFNTASRSQLKIQKFELVGAISNHKRTTTQLNNYHIEAATKNVDIYKSYQDRPKPMEPMIISRTNNVQVPLKNNYNTVKTVKTESRNSQSRMTTKSNTRRPGSKAENLQLSSKRGSKQQREIIDQTKSSHQTSQSVSFTGLSAEQVARRKNSLSKDPFTRQQQQRQILAKKHNALMGKPNFSKIQGIDAYVSCNSQKTTSRYNFSSSLKAQSNEVSMQSLKLNIQNGNSNLLKDMHSVRSGVKQKLNTGISDYVKQLKQDDKKMMQNVYKDAYTSVHKNNHNKNSSKVSYCHSRSQSQESKYNRSSKRESRRSSSKVNQSVIVPKQDSQKTRLCELKQKYNGLNRLTCGRMSLNKLNSSVQSLHSSLSRANSHAVSKQELEKYTSSRNEANSQQVSLNNKIHAESFDQKSDGGSSNHLMSYSNLRGVIQSRHQTKSVNYQSSFKNIKKVHSQVQAIRNSICLTGKNTKGTFEDVVKAEQKKQAELLKIEKMKEAKKNANNYLRRGPNKKDNRSESANHQSSRSLMRVNQQKNIQEKLFERYKLSSKPGSNKKVVVPKPNHQESVETVISVKVDQVRTPDKIVEKEQRSLTPDQKQSYQRFSKSVKFINLNLGPLLKGYKIRRIFHNNQCIKENRIKFRDLVQFVFFLQEEINDINTKLDVMGEDSILTAEHNYAKQYLGQALEEILSIRSRFQEEFHHQLQLGNSWMEQTQPIITLMNYKQESQYDKIKSDYLENMKQLLITKKEEDTQMRLFELNQAETKDKMQNQIYRTTVISTIKDLNTMEEEDDDIMQEMERHLNQKQTVYPVKVQNESPEKFHIQEKSQKMSIVENERDYTSPDKIKLSSTLQNNLKSLQSSQKVVEVPSINIQENDSPGISPNLSQYKSVKQTPYNRSPISKKQNPGVQSPIKSQPLVSKCQITPEKTISQKSFDNSPDKFSPDFEPKQQKSPVKYCQKVQGSQFQKQLSPQKRKISSPQKVQKLINSMKTTPTKFESKIPRCSSNSNSKIPRVYREAFSKSKIPNSRNSNIQSRNSSVCSSSKPKVDVPKLNLSFIEQYKDDSSPVPIQKMLDQHHSKSVSIDLHSDESFEVKLAKIKKQSIGIKKKAVEHVSFNCSKDFDKCGGLPKVDEVQEPIPFQDLSFLDDQKSGDSENCINPMQVLETESLAEEQIIQIEDIQLDEEPQVDKLPEQQAQQTSQETASIFTKSFSNNCSFIESRQSITTIESQNSKQTKVADFQTQFNKRKNSNTKISKSAKIGHNSTQKKTEKKKMSPLKENSPQKVSKFNNMNTISTENLRKEQSPDKCSPLKEKDFDVSRFNSLPVSVNQRRPRNQRSQDKSAQKPKVKALEPFKDQTEACINSPQIFIPNQSEHDSNTSKQSQDQLMNQVSQIQQMIVSLQKQKSESAASSQGAVFDEAYKAQFEQMINGLKTQFEALTK